MKSIAFPSVLLAHIIFPFFAFCQADSAWKYATLITGDNLKKHLTVIAGAGMEGRETGTEGQRKAAAYIESQFKASGLQTAEPGSYQQTYPIFKDTILSTVLKIGKKNYALGKDFLLSPLAVQNQEIKAKKIIFAGYGITDIGYDDYRGKDVSGKVVAFFTGEPKIDGKYLVTGTSKSSEWSYPGIEQKTALAKRKGAVAALIINPAMATIPAGFVANAKKSNLYLPGPAKDGMESINYATVSHAIGRDIFGQQGFDDMLKKAVAGDSLNNIAAEAASKIKLDYKKKHIPYYASNVIGFIEGGDKKNEYVLLTAHYDHLGKQGEKIYYGADDDGSGTVSVIEMAAAFARAKAEGRGPRRSIVCMTVSGEEKGLWGSQYYVDHPLFPLEKTSADLNTDMVGRIDPGRKEGDSMNYVYVIGDDKLSSDLGATVSSVNSKYTGLELDHKFNDPDDPERIFFRSDHYNFAKNGVPIIFYFDGIHNDYHRTSDTVDKINFDLMEKRVRLIFLTAWEIANRDGMLKRDMPLPADEN